MPPKKRAATNAATTAKRQKNIITKNNKPEEELEENTKQTIISKLKEADKKSNKIKIYKPDKEIPSAAVYTVRKLIILNQIKNIYLKMFSFNLGIWRFRLYVESDQHWI